MKRGEILDKAKQFITEDKEGDYGDPKVSHSLIAERWTQIADNALRQYGKLLPGHVALMMDDLKTVRLIHTIDHTDSWLDKAGYVGIGGEITFSERDPQTTKQPPSLLDKRPDW